jgi:outer membrane protein OmpA-like peptidoglycan-associated protein
MKHGFYSALVLAAGLVVVPGAASAAPEQPISTGDADKMVEAIFDDGADCGPRMADGRCAPDSDRRQIVFGDSGSKRVAAKLPPVRKFQLPVNFELGSAQLTPASRQSLERVATSYKKRSSELGMPAAIFVDGFTDHRGNCEFNLKLSEARAAAAVEYLAGLGIDRKLMTPRGFGFLTLKYPDQPESAANRRVEVVRDRGEITDTSPSC